MRSKILQIFSVSALIFTLSACSWHRERTPKAEPYFSVGSNEKQLIKSMGAPSRITLKDDIEFWHYGESWVAIGAKRVVKYSNKGSLRVERLDNAGMPAELDTPTVSQPDVADVAQEMELARPPKTLIRATSRTGATPPRRPNAPAPISVPTVIDAGAGFNDAPKGAWVN